MHRAVSHGHRSGDVARGVRAVFLERIAGQGVAVVAGVLALFAHPALLSAMAPALLPAGWSSASCSSWPGGVTAP